MTAYVQNGQYDLLKASLFYNEADNIDELELDLTTAFVQIDVYESIWDFTMSGSISILDSFNLQDVLPLYGNERIELEFTTSGNEETSISVVGLVYKVSEKHRITEHASGYNIYFISEEEIASQRMFTNKAYRDNCHNIATKIFNKVKGTSNKQLNTVSTKGIDSYVFGSMKPFEAISVLCKNAVSNNDEHGYVFYESNREFNFIPLEYLYQQEPVTEFYYRTAGVYKDVSQHTVESFQSIQKIEILEENSFLDRIMEGQQGLTSQRFDLFTKEISNAFYDKESFYNEQKSLGNISVKKSLEQSSQDMINVKYGNDSAIGINHITKSAMTRLELHTIRLKIGVYGNSNISVGDTCLATVPNWNSEQIENAGIVSGKYLIGDIHHMLTNTKYTQTILLYKDSYETQ